MNYAVEIRKLRIKMLLTQKEFADLLGVKLVTVSRRELGQFEPSMKTKRKLKNLFKENNINLGVDE